MNETVSVLSPFWLKEKKELGKIAESPENHCRTAVFCRAGLSLSLCYGVLTVFVCLAGREALLVVVGNRRTSSTMLACVACSKHEQGDGEDHSAAPAPSKPSSRDAVKSLTSQDAHPKPNERSTVISFEFIYRLQFKDMVLKLSGTHRHCKGSSSSSSSSLGKSKSLHHHHYHHRSNYFDRDVASDAGSQYDCIGAGGSSSSTPAWDFSSYSNNKVGQHEEEEREQDVVAPEEEAEPKEWMAQVEPGVHITFVSLPGGAGNDLKRIRFSREMFNKWQAQRWWGENYDRIMELYNVRSFSRQAFPTPPGSDDGEVGIPHSPPPSFLAIKQKPKRR
ncbi:hypothetical protein B296_00007244 [Ensete ventricosum]|uniref:BRX domain-containing protein n=1 Tax=Ensete ventricosum TaxID=4639 RepID=A0A427B4R2_ENSVE|nr:hypothetical protein B296_00007244 [Ensete ventricosum]